VADQVVNDPLQGREIKDIILTRVSEALDKDCTLVDDMAYPGFALKFSIDVTYTRSTTVSTHAWGNAKVGEILQELVGDKPMKDATREEIKGFYYAESPNLAREDHDLAMPVVVKGPNGPERKFVKGIPKRGRPRKNA
jgi:hypothetical protein